MSLKWGFQARISLMILSKTFLARLSNFVKGKTRQFVASKTCLGHSRPFFFPISTDVSFDDVEQLELELSASTNSPKVYPSNFQCREHQQPYFIKPFFFFEKTQVKFTQFRLDDTNCKQIVVNQLQSLQLDAVAAALI